MRTGDGNSKLKPFPSSSNKWLVHSSAPGIGRQWHIWVCVGVDVAVAFAAVSKQVASAILLELDLACVKNSGSVSDLCNESYTYNTAPPNPLRIIGAGNGVDSPAINKPYGPIHIRSSRSG